LTKLCHIKRNHPINLDFWLDRKQLEGAGGLLRRTTVSRRTKQVFLTDETNFHLNAPVINQNNCVWSGELKVTLNHVDCWWNAKNLHFLAWCQRESALVGRVGFISSRKIPKLMGHITSESCYRCSVTTAHGCLRLDSCSSKTALQLTRPVRRRTDSSVCTAKDEWPPNSPDLNPLDYRGWRGLLQAFHKTSLKAQDCSGANKHTAADLGWLAAKSY